MENDMIFFKISFAFSHTDKTGNFGLMQVVLPFVCGGGKYNM